MAVLATPALAATLRVGPGQDFAKPSEAARAARDGDDVAIDPGAYFDCAVWTARDLTVRGTGPGVTLTDLPCEGKAAFITRGERTTLRDLTFTRIRAPDRNGAGIRVEGGSLAVEGCRFINDQIGILAADATGSVLVRDSVFEDNGVPGAAADILVGRIALLRVEGSRFRDAKGGPSIVSGAALSEILTSRFEAGGSDVRPSLVSVSGGGLLMQDSEILLADVAPRGGGGLGGVGLGAILATGEGDVTLRRAALVNRTGAPAILLRDWSDGVPLLEGNRVAPGDVEVSTDGATLYHVKQLAHRVIDWLRAAAGQLRHFAARGLRLLEHSLGPSPGA